MSVAISQLKARLVRAQKFDQERVDAAAVVRKRKAPLAAYASKQGRVEVRDEDESNKEVVPPSAKVRRGFGEDRTQAAVRVPVVTPGEDADAASAHDTAYYTQLANADVEAYLRAPHRRRSTSPGLRHRRVLGPDRPLDARHLRPSRRRHAAIPRRRV